MTDERMVLLYHNAFVIFYKSSPKQNQHWTIFSEVSKMTGLAKVGFWSIDSIDRKNKINKCYKNAVPGITEVWNIKHTTQNNILKCVNCLYDNTQLVTRYNRLLRIFWDLRETTAQENSKLLLSMLNNSIITKPTDFLLFLRIPIINVSERSNNPNIPIPYQERKYILLF